MGNERREVEVRNTYPPITKSKPSQSTFTEVRWRTLCFVPSIFSDINLPRIISVFACCFEVLSADVEEGRVCEAETINTNVSSNLFYGLLGQI
jgi:hypothetical protein